MPDPRAIANAATAVIGANDVWPKHAQSYIQFFGADRGRNPLEQPRLGRSSGTPRHCAAQDGTYGLVGALGLLEASG